MCQPLSQKRDSQLTWPHSETRAHGQGEREKARGDDPFWDKTIEELKAIERDKNRTPEERERAQRIGKQTQKNSTD
jgi:hypothetical protein